MGYRHGGEDGHLATTKGGFGYIMESTQRTGELRQVGGAGEREADNELVMTSLLTAGGPGSSHA